MFLLHSIVNQLYVYIYPLPLESPSHPLPYSACLGHHRAPSWAPCVMQQLPTSSQFIHSTVYMSTLSVNLSHPHPLAASTNSFFTSARLFLPCKCVHQYHFSRIHVYVLIYDVWLSLSDLIHSVWQTQGSSTSLPLTQLHSFLWLSNIPVCVCVCVCVYCIFFIHHLLTDI